MVAVNLINTIGALEVGSVIAVFLFGIVTLQCHTYYTRFRDDPWSFKAMVRVDFLFRICRSLTSLVIQGRYNLVGIIVLNLYPMLRDLLGYWNLATPSALHMKSFILRSCSLVNPKNLYAFQHWGR